MRIVQIGKIKYKHNEIPCVCRHCRHVFRGQKTTKFCSDICRQAEQKKRAESRQGM